MTDDEPLDLGGGYVGRFFEFRPERDINPQYEGIPDVEKFGLIVDHPDIRDPSRRCSSALTFEGPVADQVAANSPRWKVESWDPLTLSPSVLCKADAGGCGSHGFIREGRWVPD